MASRPGLEAGPLCGFHPAGHHHVEHWLHGGWVAHEPQTVAGVERGELLWLDGLGSAPSQRYAIARGRRARRAFVRPEDERRSVGSPAHGMYFDATCQDARRATRRRHNGHGADVPAVPLRERDHLLVRREEDSVVHRHGGDVVRRFQGLPAQRVHAQRPDSAVARELGASIAERSWAHLEHDLVALLPPSEGVYLTRDELVVLVRDRVPGRHADVGRPRSTAEVHHQSTVR